MRNQLLKISLFFFALLFVNVSVYAQGRGQRMGPPNAEQRAKNLDELAAKLELTAEQKTKVSEVEETLFAEIQKVRKEGDRESMREKMRGLRDNHAAAMKEILSEEQFKKWEEIQKEKRQNRKPRGGKRK